MSRILNNQWRQNEKMAIQRAARLSKSLDQVLFVIYDNEEEQYNILDVDGLELITGNRVCDLDFDLVAEVG